MGPRRTRLPLWFLVTWSTWNGWRNVGQVCGGNRCHEVPAQWDQDLLLLEIMPHPAPPLLHFMNLPVAVCAASAIRYWRAWDWDCTGQEEWIQHSWCGVVPQWPAWGSLKASWVWLHHLNCIQVGCLPQRTCNYHIKMPKLSHFNTINFTLKRHSFTKQLR